MEFQYRAADERWSRSPPPTTHSPPAAPSTSGSGSADGHGGGGDGPAECVGNPALAAVASDSADELRRQAEKARIRERILREEAQQWELELEVRREIREQLLSLLWPALGRLAAGSGPPLVPPPPRIVTGNASLPVAAREAHPEANIAAISRAKRKSPDHAAASTVSAAASSKRHRMTLTCKVCGISTNSEKAMQDHVNGKVHKRKAMALLELPKPMTQPEPETGHQARVEELAPSGDYTPTKLTMLTNTGALNEVMQMDGYLLCEVCNVRTADRVTMMCHLEGSKHISKGLINGQASSKPPDQAAKEGVKGLLVPEAGTSAVASADPEPLVLELYGVSHTVRRLEGFLLCELCNVKALSMNGIRQHLLGKKHKNKANATSDVSVNVSTGGNAAAKVQLMDTDTAVVAGMSVQVEPQLTKSVEAKVDDDCELQGTTTACTKDDAATGDSTETHGEKVMKASSSAAVAEDNNFCRFDSLNMEVDNVCHPIQRVEGLLVCPCCNTKAQSEIIMRSHLAGKKHKHKMALTVRKNKKDASVLATGVNEVLGNSSKSMEANVEAESAPSIVTQAKNTADMAPMGVDSLAQDKEIEPAEDGEIAWVQSNSTKSVKAGEKAEPVPPLAMLQAKKAAAMAPMEVDDLAEVHPSTRIEPTEDGEISRVQNNSSKSMKADEEAESEPSMAAPQVKNIPTMEHMEVDGPAEVQPYVEPTEDGEITDEAGGEHAAGIANTSVAPEKESVETNDNAAPGNKTIKIQVEGKVFTVLQQQNGRLSCQACGVHGCNKDGMIVHLYSRMHWDKANLAQKEKDAAAAVVEKDGNVGSAAGECSGGALTTAV